jgi:hypothetical protein
MSEIPEKSRAPYEKRPKYYLGPYEFTRKLDIQYHKDAMIEYLGYRPITRSPSDSVYFKYFTDVMLLHRDYKDKKDLISRIVSFHFRQVRRMSPDIIIQLPGHDFHDVSKYMFKGDSNKKKKN